ncbi:hypothetical protein [Kitasatospora sp. NPDC048407]|uniref:hypothetical protein n=1 Tax=Kitasatospora sp. NPDC048407 TaxID=3364051 RepID=UPI0037114B9F
MSEYPAPPLPAAPALTLAAADQWRAARVWQRLNSRWLALLPAVTVVLAIAFDRTPDRCDSLRACTVPYAESAAPAVLLVEFLALLLRRRTSFVVPAAAGLLLWFLPNALPGPWLPTAACAAHLLAAAALYREDAGLRRAEAQLATLMGPPMPYPWTLRGADSPIDPPSRPRVRHILAALFGAAAVVLLAVGVWQTEDDLARAARADRTWGTVRSIHDGGDSATVEYRLPHEYRTLTAEVDGDRTVGDQVPLLVDGTGWYRAADEWQDSAAWWLGVGAAGTFAVLLLLSARRTTVARRTIGDSAPALRVRARRTVSGVLEVLPVDGGDREAGLWRVMPFGDEAAQYAPADLDGPAAWIPDPEDDEDDDEGEGEGDEDTPVALGKADAPVEALLYHWGGGRNRLVVLRSSETPHKWTAARAVVLAAPSKRDRDGEARDEEAQLKAQVARSLADDRAEDPGGSPEPARVFGLPTALRCAAAPVAAVLIGAVMNFLADQDSLVDNLLRPLVMGSGLLLGVMGGFGWQLAVDRDGVVLSGVLRVRRASWQQVTAAALHSGRVTVRYRSRPLFGFSAGPARLLHRHFGGEFDPQQVARIVTALAQRPERRPLTALPAGTVGSMLWLNRLVLAGYMAWAVAQYLLR